jgi:dihydroflavonol-4-reductase
MVVVTGATGHIGNVLVRELLADGEQVRAFVLPEDDLAPLANLDVEIFHGDILNYESLLKAFAGADIVYHLAAIISLDPKDLPAMREINISGTTAVIEACLERKVRRLVYTSSIHALPVPEKPGAPIHESKEFRPETMPSEYDQTKAVASAAVEKAVAERGLDAVLVCPTGVIGPYDFKRSKMGQMFERFLNQRLFAYIGGSFNFVDVRDVARGHILAAKRGRPGETYILAGEKIEIAELLEAIRQVSGSRWRPVRIPVWLAYLLLPLISLWHSLTRTEPLLTAYTIHTLTASHDIDSDKAQRELGYHPRPIKESIQDTVVWLREQQTSEEQTAPAALP